MVSGTGGRQRYRADAPCWCKKSALCDGPIAYVRVGRVGQGLADQVSAALKEFNNNTNQIKGLVLDLRYAGGHDYAAAAAVADLFVGKEMALLDWGNGLVQSKVKSDAVTIPVTVLVNHQTAAAAEALAAVMRQADRALILGANTAGEASIDQEFPAEKRPVSPHRHRHHQTRQRRDHFPRTGVTPDIAVTVKPGGRKSLLRRSFQGHSRLKSAGRPGFVRHRHQPASAQAPERSRPDPRTERGARQGFGQL